MYHMQFLLFYSSLISCFEVVYLCCHHQHLVFCQMLHGSVSVSQLLSSSQNLINLPAVPHSVTSYFTWIYAKSCMLWIVRSTVEWIFELRDWIAIERIKWLHKNLARKLNMKRNFIDDGRSLYTVKEIYIAEPIFQTISSELCLTAA